MLAGSTIRFYLSLMKDRHIPGYLTDDAVLLWKKKDYIFEIHELWFIAYSVVYLIIGYIVLFISKYMDRCVQKC